MATEADKQWYEKNRDRRREYNRVWAAANREVLSQEDYSELLGRQMVLRPLQEAA